MQDHQLERYRHKYSAYHLTNPNKPPIGTIIGGQFVRLEDALEQLAMVASLHAEVLAEEREERLRGANLTTAWCALEGGE